MKETTVEEMNRAIAEWFNSQIFNGFETRMADKLRVAKPRLTYFQALSEIDNKDAVVKRLAWGRGNACLLRCGGSLYKIRSKGVGCDDITIEDMQASDYIVLQYYKK